MPELPKIVRDRLRVSKAAAGHPDADVLTAFAEHVLPKTERALVMEHLARCVDCRDVVALALPASETAEMARSARAGSGRLSGGVLRWPVLRWGVVAAAIIVMASVGILWHEQRNQTSAGMKSFSRNAVARDEIADARPPSSAPSVFPQTEQRKDSVAAKKELGPDSRQRTKLAMAQPPHDLDFALAPQPAPETAAKQLPSRNLFPRPGQVPSRSTNEAKPADAELTAQNQLQDQLAGRQSANKIAESANVAVVERAKPPVATQQVEVAAGAAPLQSPAPPAASSLSELAVNRATLASHWTVNVSGDLLRSLDGGQTWQEVNVIPAAADDRMSFYARESSLKAPAKTAKAKADVRAPDVTARDATARDVTVREVTEKDKKLVFRSVVAIGSEVWAGGSGGALFHSADAGDHWTRIIPSAAGASLTGDITTVDFSDPQHGKLATSTFEVWTTSDGGLNWQKQ